MVSCGAWDLQYVSGDWVQYSNTYWKADFGNTEKEATLKYNQTVGNFTTWELWFRYDGQGYGYGPRFSILFNDDIDQVVYFKVKNATKSLAVIFRLNYAKMWWWYDCSCAIKLEVDGYERDSFFKDTSDLYHVQVIFWRMENETDKLKVSVRVWDNTESRVIGGYDEKFNLGNAFFTSITLSQEIYVYGKGWIEGWKYNEKIYSIPQYYTPYLPDLPTWLDQLAFKIWKAYINVIWTPLPQWGKDVLDLIFVQGPIIATWVLNNFLPMVKFYIIFVVLSSLFAVMMLFEEPDRFNFDRLKKALEPLIDLFKWLYDVFMRIIDFIMSLIPF